MQANQISSREVRTRSMIEVRRLNTTKPHGDATTTIQTTNGPRQTMCRSHSPPASRRATLPRKAGQNVAPHPTGHTRVTKCKSKCPAYRGTQANVPACRKRPDRSCSPKRDRHPASSPVSAKLLETCWVIMIRSLFSNRQQRIHALNLSFSCLRSLCDAAGGQHPSRKPCRDAGRLSTVSWHKTLKS